MGCWRVLTPSFGEDVGRPRLDCSHVPGFHPELPDENGLEVTEATEFSGHFQTRRNRQTAVESGIHHGAIQHDLAEDCLIWLNQLGWPDPVEFVGLIRREARKELAHVSLHELAAETVWTKVCGQ